MADGLATPVWFGQGLFGWWHYPSNQRARGGVVLCPPLGTERISAHDAFRLLAESLVAEDMAVLRFDYLGTGDSVGTLDTPGGVEAWLENVESAIEFLRRAGVRHTGVVGMRMGRPWQLSRRDMLLLSMRWCSGIPVRRGSHSFDSSVL